MPEISRFFGIIIRMYFGDHLPPHFHAEYGEHRAVVDIHSLVTSKATRHRTPHGGAFFYSLITFGFPVPKAPVALRVSTMRGAWRTISAQS